MPHEATVRFLLDPRVFHDCDLVRVCPRVFHDCDICCCADAWVMCRPMKWSAHACAVAHAVLVLVYEHEQLLMSGICSNVHVLSG
jgi:hypothetical protein